MGPQEPEERMGRAFALRRLCSKAARLRFVRGEWVGCKRLWGPGKGWLGGGGW